MRDEMWGSIVEVVSCDMRQWDAPQKADIIISELLGSFGDNELCPECLDGAQKFLKGQLRSCFPHCIYVSISMWRPVDSRAFLCRAMLAHEHLYVEPGWLTSVSMCSLVGS